MRPRAAAWLAWACWGLTLALAGLMFLFMALGAAAGVPVAGVRPIDIGFSVALLAFATVGAIVASRRPANALGWLFCGLGLAMALVGFARAYAIYALLALPGALPGGELLAWLHSVGAVVATGAAAGFVLLLFPHGHLPSRRWRPVAWLTVVGMLLMSVGLALQPGPLELGGLSFVDNPLGMEGAGGFLRVLESVGFVLLIGGILGAAASMIARLRTTRGVERLQLKWMAYAAALVGLAILVAAAVYFALGSLVATNLAGPLVGATLAGIPVAAGVAILRYHLYEIDVLIRRTVVYALLTASLGLVYWGSIVLLQQLLRPFTEGSELAIIGSTLAVAALFQPARRRAHDVVDRRFYRRKYDAQQTLEAFSARLREQTDLDSLGRELVGVVRQTVQPAKVSLWLRTPERKT